MRVAIGNVADSYSSMLHIQRVAVNSFLAFSAHKAVLHQSRAGEDASRKRNSTGNSSQFDTEREHLFEDNDAVMQHLVRKYGTRCAKCLLEGHEALYFNYGKCTKGITHIYANTLTAMNDANLSLPR